MLHLRHVYIGRCMPFTVDRTCNRCHSQDAPQQVRCSSLSGLVVQWDLGRWTWGRGFDSRSFRYRVTSNNPRQVIHTHVPLFSYEAVQIGTRQRAQDLSKGEEHPVALLMNRGTCYVIGHYQHQCVIYCASLLQTELTALVLIKTVQSSPHDYGHYERKY